MMVEIAIATERGVFVGYHEVKTKDGELGPAVEEFTRMDYFILQNGTGRTLIPKEILKKSVVTLRVIEK